MFEALAGGHYLAVLAAAACGLAGAATFRLVRARRRVAQMATALDNMSQGLCMFDASQRLVLCNRSYLKMYDLSPDVVKPGCSLRQLLHYRIKRGVFTSDPEQYIANLMASLAQPAGHAGTRRQVFVPVSNAVTGATSAFGAPSFR